jgi:nucleoside-diphosphate-sugar epimerase
MKVLAAGATGAIGRPTISALLSAGDSVRGTARGKRSRTPREPYSLL